MKVSNIFTLGKIGDRKENLGFLSMLGWPSELFRKARAKRKSSGDQVKGAGLLNLFLARGAGVQIPLPALEGFEPLGSLLMKQSFIEGLKTCGLHSNPSPSAKPQRTDRGVVITTKLRITYFVHGTTTDNEAEIATGWNQGKLSEVGIKQSKELAKTISDNRCCGML